MSYLQKLLARLRVARSRPNQAWAWPQDRDVRGEAIIWAHRLLLGRDPESAVAIAAMSAECDSIEAVIARISNGVAPSTTAALALGAARLGRPWVWPTTDVERRQACLWAYRLLLEREPESAMVLTEQANRQAGLRSLKGEFLGSLEFNAKYAPTVKPAMSGREPPQRVDVDATDAVRAALFQRVQEIWQRLGEAEAHWSVATIEDFRPDRIQESLATFFATGERDIETLWCTLKRVGIDTTRIATALDFGCGVGRLSMALAKRVRALESADVSASHLKLAQETAVERQQTNIRFHHLKRIGDIADLPAVDLVYSVIVLQHNPPPVICSIFAQLLGRLNQGGVAVVQVPTYLPEGYAFDAEAYGTTHSTQMEMHPLPQRVAFSVIRSAGCDVLEVLEDAWTGYGYGARSNTFVIQRPAP